MADISYLLSKETERVCAVLDAHGEKKLSELFRNCYKNTFETTTKRMSDGTTYIFTGDIPAMWLRDSTAQVHQYLPFAAKNEDVADVLEGLIRRQLQCVLYDPYANAFNEEENAHGHIKDIPLQKPMIWERKYEVDSLCFVLQLCSEFYAYTGRTGYLKDELFVSALRQIVSLWKTEQHHMEQSPYRFQRLNAKPKDTLTNDGLGNPVAYTGMTWSGFRPSDDACICGYLVPSNMFAAVVLHSIADVCAEVLDDGHLVDEIKALEKDIREGIEKYAIVDDPELGRMYAYETDGMGNYTFMDDSNVPSLLAAPYFGFCAKDDPIYLNTRKFILSKRNPFYFEGKVLRGTGSPHTPDGYVWHIGLVLQGLTATDPKEVREILDMLCASDADTGYMHEGVNADDPTQFTRPWFAWANSIFSELVLQYVQTLEDAENA